ncbi:TMEM43 family protein [Phreatobacter stygius]|uniref:Uncharacterized protein n=1 Tax=Phreatobacter stygius TaxID=1940610 RepID=A0A4D7B2G0_9HYPH|nr:TMEM43 family protein [Phreatobacter stygius]QCI65223.1 hypothetical protein E8M01_13985 [Phreatobacter stygius]
MTSTAISGHRLPTQYVLAAGCVLAAILLMVVGQHIDRRLGRRVDRIAAGIVSIDPARLNPAHDGRLVHVTGIVTAQAPVVDPDTGFQADGLKLTRQVEMFQWMRLTGADSASRTIAARWLGFGYPTMLLSIDGKPDGRSNPPMPLMSRTMLAPGMLIGDLPLDPRLAERIAPVVRQPVSAGALPALAARLGRNDLRLVGGRIVSAVDPAAPEVGDLAISYSLEVAGPAPVSLIARQQGDRLVPVSADEARILPVTMAGGVHDAGYFAAQARAAVGHDWSWTMRLLALGLVAMGCCVVIYWGADLTGRDHEIGGILLMIPVLLVAAPVWGLAMLLALVMGLTWWALALGMAGCLAVMVWLTLHWLDRGPGQQA